MSSGQSLAYHLRPNKAVDREVFLDLLSFVNSTLPLADYEYIGLGGPFLEDFRLLRSRLGLKNLTCVEKEEEVHCRQLLNRPPCVTVHLGDLQEYLSSRDLSNTRAVLWFDFTAWADESNLELVASTARQCASPCMLKVTFNAAAPRVQKKPNESMDEFHGRRVNVARRALGKFAPAWLEHSEVTKRGFGQVVLDSIERALDSEMLGSTRTYLGVSAYQYADGLPMVTATALVCDATSRDETLDKLELSSWEFFQNDWPKAQLIDMPVLSAFERILVDRLLETMEEPGESISLDLTPPQRRGRWGRCVDAVYRRLIAMDTHAADSQQGRQFTMPRGSLGERTEVVESFKRFSRLYPHFARIEV